MLIYASKFIKKTIIEDIADKFLSLNFSMNNNKFICKHQNDAKKLQYKTESFN